MNREANGPELTVGEVSQRTGVTVRTLHHYDAVGILPPSDRTEAGYRIYDEVAVGRLFRILARRSPHRSEGARWR